jgi:catechol 2,3-dioxygenase-like lactoylglutathione lyase family enzyme
MTIDFCSILVDDQEKALEFYTEVLGFIKMADFPMGDFRFLTVASPDNPKGAQIIIEKTTFEPSKTYQKALFEAGIPAIALTTRDIYSEIEKLKRNSVAFRGEPKNAGPIINVLFEDTCGNLINLVQPKMMAE